ncbi:MAG TPA: hypothetical protein VKB78_03645, partial [Pirellulales bacterium]|nr:hypothetical protein [Pirellulales bacterium]
SVSEDDLRDAERELRELTFHPDRFIDESRLNGATAGESSPLLWIEEKRRRIREPFAASEARERCRAIRNANERLQPWVAERRAATLARAANVTRQLRADSILASREYGFCLYPEKNLREFLLAFPSE